MRVPLRSGMEVTLAELQTAFELGPEADVHCLAYMAKTGVCKEVPKFSLQERNRIFRGIADEMVENGPAIASDNLEELLNDLASTLICTKIKHPMWIIKGRTRCSQVDHVAEILRIRLETFEEARHTRRKAEVLIRSRKPAGRKGKMRESSPDDPEYGDTENEGISCNNSTDGEDSELDDEPTTALAHRPKSVRRHQVIDKSDQHILSPQMKTPNRVHQKPSGSGRRHRKSDASDASTPDTAVSKVFSTASSKWSAATAPTHRPSTSRPGLNKQRNESPTRHGRSHDGEDTTDTSTDPNSDSEYVDEGGSSDGSWSSSSSSQSADQEDSEPEAVFTEDEEDHPQVTIAFKSSGPKPSKADHILGLMLSKIKRAPHGYVYCFSDVDAEGYLKIGYAGIRKVREMQPESKMPISSKDTRTRLWERLESQRQKCKFNMKFEFDVYMPSGAHKMETLIHATLQEHNRVVTSCKSSTCSTKHKEWFKITLEHAKHTVYAWRKFSRLKPYTANGALVQEWYDYARDHLNDGTFAKLSAHDWFHEEWETRMAQAIKQQRKLLKASEAKIKKAEKEVAHAKEVVDETKRLVSQTRLDRFDEKLRIAEWEDDQASKRLKDKERKLALMKKKRASLG